MYKGVSGVVVAILLLVVSVVAASGFWFWGRGVSEDFERTTTEDVERELADLNSNIGIARIVASGGDTDVTVVNRGETFLEASKMSIFFNGNPERVVSITPDVQSFGPGESVVFRVAADYNQCLTDVKVSGQYGTVDEYRHDEYFFNTTPC